MNLDTIEKSIAWQKGYKLAKRCYEITSTFPGDEKYNMTSQVKRSALSVPFNIAEGRFRKTKREFAYFLSVARGSCAELATQFMLSYDFGYITREELREIKIQAIELIKILQASINTLKKQSL